MIKTPYGQVPCGGEIDYDAGFNYLVCTKCGRTYQARDLANESKDILILNSEGREDIMSRVRIIDPKTHKVIIDDCTSTRNYISKEKYEAYLSHSSDFTPVEKVGGTRTRKRKSKEEMKNSYYTQLVLDNFNKTAPVTTPLSEALGMTSKVKVGGTITNGKKDIPVVTGTDDSKDDGIKRVQVKLETAKEVIEKGMEVLSDDATDKAEAIYLATRDVSDKIKKAVDTVVENIMNTAGEIFDNELNEENTEEESSENINIENFSIGQNVTEEEPDYSNYEAEDAEEEQEDDSDEDEPNYTEYIKKIRKEKHKQQKFDKDMEDY